ncbi:helix-turn-helix domain-containing protein [Peribacillus simplex]|uniref:Helix-turn-helix domain-containing protein n=2 Tax=Peribacillus TaxID=2675229 RepID=A0AA90PGG0_9BACI|nr:MULTISPECIES: helix-turn-helix domain-containing protein [Peribacillus]MDP1419762.1 helix-turn-helix domain-containing protein [Peribacillus simplex]MDP1453002.1 helix-turn-helix domain-containing protein [Peribacillus frigoritolerans]
MDEIINVMKKIGFTQYESQAYIGLLKHSPITGYEVSKRSGVPRSMVYQVLEKLLEKRAIYKIPSDPVTYEPLPVEDLINRSKIDYEASLNYLKNELKFLKVQQDIHTIKRIPNAEIALSEMRTMIREAKEELWLSLWEAQWGDLEESIRRKEKENLPIFSILFGSEEKKAGFTTYHNYMASSIIEERTQGNLTIIVKDKNEVLIANFSRETEAWAITTKDPALVLLALEYIGHDIMFSQLIKELGPEKMEVIWKNNPFLYHIVTGKRFN